MKSRLISLVGGATLALFSLTTPGLAAGNMLALSIGAYDVGVIGSVEDRAVTFGAEYRSGYALLWRIKPMAGVLGNSDGSFYGYGGFYADFNLGDLISGAVAKRIFITPSAAVGGYAQGSSNKDLGDVVEFRTGVEIAYRLNNGARIGVAFHHISNAGLGSSSGKSGPGQASNPGTEIVAAVLVLPLDNLFGK